MKLAELQPDVEYAQIAGIYRHYKVKFSAESLAEGISKRYSTRGKVLAQIYNMDFISREWRWMPIHIPLNQVKMTWAEYEIEKAEREKEQQERAHHRRVAEEKRAQETKELNEYLRENRETLVEVLGEVSTYAITNRLEVRLSLEAVKRLIERVK